MHVSTSNALMHLISAGKLITYYNCFPLVLGTATEPMLVAMIYNWKTAEWTEDIELANVPDISMPDEFHCAIIVYKERLKVVILFRDESYFDRCCFSTDFCAAFIKRLL